MKHTQAQRTAAALLAQGSRLGILSPRSDAELARLDRIADDDGRPFSDQPGPGAHHRRRAETLSLWPET